MLTYSNVYGLGGDKHYGFKDGFEDKPNIAWSCPTEDHRAELAHFGDYVEVTEFFRNPGTDESVPDELPCQETFYEPLYPELEDPDGPSCDDIEDHVYCYQVSVTIFFAGRSKYRILSRI
jgi:hypothetical protein